MDREKLFKGVDENLLQKWRAFDAANPKVYESFKVQAFKVHAIGFKHYSAWTILTAVRFQYDLETDRADDEFKINNDFVALYARKFLYDYPHMEGFFELRSLKTRKSSEADKGDDMKRIDKAVIGIVFLIFSAVGIFTMKHAEGVGYKPKAEIQTVEITASGGSPIPAAFDYTNSQSLIQSSALNCNTLKVISTVNARCYMKFADSGTSSPASTVDGSHVIAAATLMIDYADNLKIKKFWFLRCTGAPTTGDVVVQCF